MRWIRHLLCGLLFGHEWKEGFPLSLARHCDSCGKEQHFEPIGGFRGFR